MAVGHRSTKVVKCALVCFSFCPLVQELLKTQTALRNLIQRNRDLPVEVLAARNKEAQKGPTALQLPFILIQVSLSGGISRANCGFRQTAKLLHLHIRCTDRNIASATLGTSQKSQYCIFPAKLPSGQEKCLHEDAI